MWNRENSRCAFESVARISLDSFVRCVHSLSHHRKIVRFHALFPLYQIYCMYRLKFIHINHIINTHLQCTKTSCNIYVLLACLRANCHCIELANERTLCTRTYTKYDKSNACNFKLFGSATVIYSIFSASRAPNLSRIAHSEIPQKPVYA